MTDNLPFDSKRLTIRQVDLVPPKAPPEPVLESPTVRGKDVARSDAISLLSLPDGTIINGRYTITRVLGSGAFGTVFEGSDLKLGRPVAIKIGKIPIDGADQTIEDAKRRFEREAHHLAVVKPHPNIVAVYDLTEWNQRLCIVMEYVDGKSLADYIQTLPEKRMSPEDALKLTIQILQALDHIHNNKVDESDGILIHRDIKPGNILLVLDKDGNIKAAKLVDLGLALKIAFGLIPPSIAPDLAALAPGMDESAEQPIAGTPDYMSPEQARGHSYEVKPASDIFSLGTVLYQLLTGKLPFTGSSTTEVMLKIRSEEPVRFPDDSAVPAEIMNIVLKMLEKDLEKRFKTAYEVINALDTLQNPKKPPGYSRSTLLTTAAGVGLTALGLGGLVGVVVDRELLSGRSPNGALTRREEGNPEYKNFQRFRNWNGEGRDILKLIKSYHKEANPGSLETLDTCVEKVESVIGNPDSDRNAYKNALEHLKEIRNTVEHALRNPDLHDEDRDPLAQLASQITSTGLYFLHRSRELDRQNGDRELPPGPRPSR